MTGSDNKVKAKRGHIHWCPQECSEGCHGGHDYECDGECRGFGGPKKKSVRCSLHAIYRRVE